MDASNLIRALQNTLRGGAVQYGKFNAAAVHPQKMAERSGHFILGRDFDACRENVRMRHIPAYIQFKRRNNMSLDTDLTAAQPFLIKPDVSGNNIEANAHEIKDDSNYLYHATNFRNLQKIKTYGLDPKQGGQGGAGAAVGGAAGAYFNRNSKGKVHGTSSLETASSYALMKDDPALFVRAYGNIGDLDSKPAPQALGDFAIILRFSRNSSRVRWEKDPDDTSNAFRTHNAIPSSVIEGLTTEGWKKIVDLTNLDEALTGS